LLLIERFFQLSSPEVSLWFKGCATTTSVLEGSLYLLKE